MVPCQRFSIANLDTAAPPTDPVFRTPSEEIPELNRQGESMRPDNFCWLPTGAALLAGLVLAAAAADAPAPFRQPPTEFECRWADSPIVIDGKPDDAAWKAAPVIDRFYLPWLGKNVRDARPATKARLLWHREYRAFCAEMEESDLYADVKEPDGPTWENDVFELFLKPAADKPGYYEFQVNAAGTVLDMFLPRRGAGGYGRFKKDGDFHVEAKVRLDGTLNHWQDRDKGWTVEGRIPWKDFLRTGGRPEPGETWRFALCRYDYSVDFEGPEMSTCAPLKTDSFANFHRHEDYAALKFVGPEMTKRVPLTNSKVVGSPDPPPPYRPKRVYPNVKPDFPIAIVRQPGSDRLLYVAQKWSYGPAALYRMKDDPDARDAELLLEFAGGAVAYDVKFHPDFANNGQVFVGLNGPSAADPKVKATQVVRYHIDPKPPHTFDPKSARLIIEWSSDGHNGGALGFGKDGMLYVTSG